MSTRVLHVIPRTCDAVAGVKQKYCHERSGFRDFTGHVRKDPTFERYDVGVEWPRSGTRLIEKVRDASLLVLEGATAEALPLPLKRGSVAPVWDWRYAD